MDIDWQKVFEKGSEKLGESFGSSFGTSLGTAIGGPVGAALATAILGLGANRDDDLAKIDERLGKIEQQLKELTHYLIDVLPTVIYNQSLAANIEEQRQYFQPYRTDLQGVFRAFLEDPDRHESALSEAIRELLVRANFLANQGPPFYSHVFAVLTAATAVFNQLLNRSKSYGSMLTVWANTYQKILENWTNPDIKGSLASELNGLISERKRAQSFLERYPKGIKHCAIMIDGPVIANFPNGTTYQYSVIVGYLDRPAAEPWAWTGGTPFLRQVTLEYEIPEDQLQRVCEQLSVGDSHQIPIYDRAFLLRKWPSGWHMGDFLNHLSSWYNKEIVLDSSLPPRIGQATEVVNEIERFKAITSMYAKPENAFVLDDAINPTVIPQKFAAQRT